MRTRLRGIVAAFAVLMLTAAGMFTGSTALAAPISTSPLLSYDFSDGQGTTVSDTSGNGNDGTIVGGEDWLAGMMRFNGENHVQMPEGILAGKDAATIVVETSPVGLVGNQFLWNIGGKATGDMGTGQFFVDPRAPRAVISETNWQGEQNARSETTKLLTDQWQSVATTIAANGDGTSTLRFYIDGVLVAENLASATNLSDLQDHTRNFIARSAYDADGLYSGLITSFEIYDVALPAADLVTIAQRDAQAAAAETIANLDLQAVNAQDLAAVETDIVLPTAGGVTWTSSSAVISADGTVAPAETATDVVLTASVDVRGETGTKEFPVHVLADLPGSEKVAKDLAAITLVNQNDVRGNLTLPDLGALYDSDITWTSSHSGIIDVSGTGGVEPGVVTRPTNGDTVVTLTVTATNGTETGTRTFEVTVRQAAVLEPTTDYLFAHFTGLESKHTDEQIYFATSHDGISFDDTRTDGNPILALAEDEGDGGVRDPYIVRSPEGDKFFMIATDLSIYHRGGWGNARATETGSTNIVVWESNDLVNWSEPRLIDIAGPIADAGNMWAPEAYWDETEQAYFVFWATRSAQLNQIGDEMNMYGAWTRDFVTFTDPELWIDRQHSIIDTTVIKVGDWYYRASGDGQITIEKSKKLDAPTIAANPLTTGTENEWVLVGTLQSILGGTNTACNTMTNFTGGCYEGPEFFKFNDDDVDTTTYGLYSDLYGAGMGYKAFQTADPGSSVAADWSFESDTDFGGLKKRHGTILPITAAEYEQIRAAFDPNYAAPEPVAPEHNPAVPAEGLLAEYIFTQTTGTSVPNIVEGGAPATVVNGHDGLWTGDSLTFTGGAKDAGGPWVKLPADMLSDADSATINVETKIDESMLNTFHFLWNIGSDSNQSYLFSSVRADSRTAITVGGHSAEVNARGPQLDPDRWYSLTTVIDGDAGTISWYVDGELMASVPTDVVPSNILNQELNAIGRGPYPDPLYKGEVTAFRVYDRALTADEVAAISAADAQFHPAELTATAESLVAGIQPLVFDDSVVQLNTRDGDVAWSSDWAPVTVEGGSAIVQQPATGENALEGTLTATANVRGMKATTDVAATVLPEAAPEDGYGYLMVHFIENPGGYSEKIYLDISRGNNPEQWDPLNGGEPILTSNLGTTGVRDPYITYNPDTETYYIIATDLRVFGGENGSGNCTSWCHWSTQGSTMLNVWESKDLIHWSEQRQIDVTLAPDGTKAAELGMAWAPEATWEPDYYGPGEGAFVMYWASTQFPEGDTAHATPGAYDSIMWAATTDFTQGTFEFGGVLFDRGGNTIDTTVIQHNGVTYHVTKDNAYGTGLYMESTDDPRWWEPDTQWTPVENRLGAEWAGGNPGGVEGPAMFKKHDEDLWYLYADVIPTTGYRPLSTTNLAEGFDVLNSPDFYMAPSTKHGGIIGLTKAQYDAIRAADGEAVVEPDITVTVPAGASGVTEAEVLAQLPDMVDVKLAYNRGIVAMPVSWQVTPLDDGGFTAVGVVDEIGANLNSWSATGVDPELSWGGADAARTLLSTTELRVIASIVVEASEPSEGPTDEPTEPAEEPTAEPTEDPTNEPVSGTDPQPSDGSQPTNVPQPSSPQPSGALSFTGAAMTLPATVAFLLIAGGVVLVLRRKNEQS